MQEEPTHVPLMTQTKIEKKINVLRFLTQRPVLQNTPPQKPYTGLRQILRTGKFPIYFLNSMFLFVKFKGTMKRTTLDNGLISNSTNSKSYS